MQVSVQRQPQETPTFWEEYSGATKEEALSFEARKIQEKIEMCGVWFTRLDLASGGLGHYEYQCNQYQNGCIRCLDRYTEAETKRLQGVGNTLLLAKVNGDNWETVNKQLRRNDIFYQRTERKTGESFVIVPEDISEEMKSYLGVETFEATKENIRELLQGVKTGGRISGKLGKGKKASGSAPKAVKEDTEEEKVKISVEHFSTTASAKQRRQAWSKTIDLTSYLDPKDELSLRIAVNKRVETYKNLLIESGAKITHVRKRTDSVRLSTIDWGRHEDIRTLKKVPDGERGRAVRPWQSSELISDTKDPPLVA